MTMKTTFAAAAIGLGFGLASAAQAETVLTVSSWVPQTHFIYTDILVPYAENVAKVTEGRVTLNIMPAPLGTPPQHFELARTGVADITWGNFTYEPERFTAMWFAEFPFVGTDAEAASAALWRTYDKHLANDPTFDGVHMLAVGLLGAGRSTTDRKPSSPLKTWPTRRSASVARSRPASWNRWVPFRSPPRRPRPMNCSKAV